jgi:hypothetical protein
MPTPLLTLGPFSFEGLESPERILLKSKQRLVVHHLGSGSSTVDSLGEDYEIVSFRGVFSGRSATARIRTIEHLKIQGNPLPLVWSSRLLSVIIHGFELNYTSARWIPYKLICYVVHPIDPLLALAADIMSASPAAQVDDIVTLLGYTMVSPLPLEITGLLELAEMNYDTPPTGALQRGREFSRRVEGRIAILELARQQRLSDPIQSSNANGRDLAAKVADAGEQANLILARGRLTDITVRAERANQP